MKQAVLLILILLPSAMLAWWNRDMPQLGVHHDDAIYWESAKSLATGQGYRLLSYPGEPFQTKYPPLFPALLSVAWKLDPVFPRNLQWAALIAWGMMPFYLLLVHRVIRDFGFSNWWSWIITAAVGFNVMTVLLSLSLMSELAFSVLLLTILILAERDDIPGWGLGLLAGAAFLLRSLALPLALTVPLCFWLRGRRRDAVWFVCTMLPILACWQVWARLHQASMTDATGLYYTNYLGFHLKHVHLKDLPVLFWTNLEAFFSATGRLLIFNPDEGFWAVQLSRITSFAALMGAYRLVKSTRRYQFAAYALGASVMLLLWHYPPSPRFVYALYPLLLAGWVTEMRHLFGMLATALRKPKREERIAAVLLGGTAMGYVCLFLWFTYAGLAILMPSLLESRRDWTATHLPVFQWIKTNTDPTAEFFAYDDVMLNLYTGRHAVGSPIPPDLLFHSDDAGIEAFVKATPAMARDKSLGYLLLTDSDYSRDLHEDRMRLLRKTVSEDKRYEEVYRDPHCTVYRYLPRPPELRPPPVSAPRPPAAGAEAAAAFPAPEETAAGAE
ncbi:MAG: hypothetical protein ABJF23_01685 [Bryobacteraceae bacterium]